MNHLCTYLQISLVTQQKEEIEKKTNNKELQQHKKNETTIKKEEEIEIVEEKETEKQKETNQNLLTLIQLQSLYNQAKQFREGANNQKAYEICLMIINSLLAENAQFSVS